MLLKATVNILLCSDTAVNVSTCFKKQTKTLRSRLNFGIIAAVPHVLWKPLCEGCKRITNGKSNRDKNEFVRSTNRTIRTCGSRTIVDNQIFHLNHRHRSGIVKTNFYIYSRGSTTNTQSRGFTIFRRFREADRLSGKGTAAAVLERHARPLRTGKNLIFLLFTSLRNARVGMPANIPLPRCVFFQKP